MKTVYKKYRREWSALLALFVTIILFSILEPAYLSVANISTIVTQSVTYGLMGIGMTCVIITSGIDLSVGSALAFVACIAAQLAKAGVPIPIWVVICLAMGFGLGAFNGFLVGTLKLQPFVATMGTMSIYRGVSYVITGGFPVLSVPRDYRNVFNFRLTSTMTFSVVVFFIFAIIM
ncbi:MAG: ABC transporter permease, partial [Clostridia bacterium]|nr:ABC transporter permease [Clostridia bacterium]